MQTTWRGSFSTTTGIGDSSGVDSFGGEWTMYLYTSSDSNTIGIGKVDNGGCDTFHFPVVDYFPLRMACMTIRMMGRRSKAETSSSTRNVAFFASVDGTTSRQDDILIVAVTIAMRATTGRLTHSFLIFLSFYRRMLVSRSTTV